MLNMVYVDPKRAAQKVKTDHHHHHEDHRCAPEDDTLCDELSRSALELLSSPEIDIAQQGLELLIALDARSIWEMIRRGFTFTMKSKVEAHLTLDARYAQGVLEAFHPAQRLLIMLTALRELGSPLETLKTLELSGVGETFPLDVEALSLLPALSTLKLADCHALVTRRGGAKLERLERLYLSGEVSDLRSLSAFSTLKRLYLKECVALERLEGVDACAQLSHLHISGAHSLRSLTGLERANSLESVYLYDNWQLEHLNQLPRRAPLRALHIEMCGVLFDLQWLPSRSQLKTLYLNQVSLDDLSALRRCKRLTSLTIDRGALRSLEGLGACRHLRALKLLDLRGLTSLRGAERCRRLHHFEARWCAQLESLQGLPDALVSLVSSSELSVERGAHLTLQSDQLTRGSERS